jgi:hypothetical protein
MSSTESRATPPTILSRILQRTSLVWVLLLAFFLAGCGFYSIYLGADADWDLLNYHLYIPFAFLKARLSFDVQPAQAQTYLNPLLDLPFFLLIRHFNDYPRFVGFVQGATNGISLFCILILAWRLLGSVTGLSTWARIALSVTALVIGGTGADSLGLIGRTTGDIPVTTLVLCALVFAVQAVESSAVGGRVLVAALASGLLAGLAFGLKPTVGSFGLGLFVLLVMLRPPWRLKGELCFLLSAASGFLIAAGPHAIRMYRMFGNPAFPMFNAVFHSPYFDNTTNGVLRGTFVGSLLMESMSHPLSFLLVAVELPFLSLVRFHVNNNHLADYRDVRLAIAIVLILLVFALWLTNRMRGRESTTQRAFVGLALFLLVGTFVSLMVFNNYRYLGPVECVSGVLIVLALGELVGRRRWIATAATVAVVCVVTTAPIDFPRAQWGERYISIDAPALDPRTLVVIATDRGAASFLVPFFDPRIRWVRTRSNLIPPNGRGLLVDRVRGLIAGHQGPLVSVEITEVPLASRASILEELLLERTEAPCTPFNTNLTDLHYVLCPVRKLASPAGLFLQHPDSHFMRIYSAAAFECPSRRLRLFNKSSAASAITVPGGKIASAPAFLSAS